MIPIEVARPDRCPSRRRTVGDRTAAGPSVPVHLPDRSLAGACIVPQDVRGVAAEERARSNRCPTDPGLLATAPPPIRVFASISQTEAWPVLAFCHKMSAVGALHPRPDW